MCIFNHKYKCIGFGNFYMGFLLELQKCKKCGKLRVYNTLEKKVCDYKVTNEDLKDFTITDDKI